MVEAQTPASVFHLFPQLSPELRDMIWEECYTATRAPALIVIVPPHGRKTPSDFGSVLLKVCHESRVIASKHLRLMRSQRVHIDLATDIMYCESLEALCNLGYFEVGPYESAHLHGPGNPPGLTMFDLETALKHILLEEDPAGEFPLPAIDINFLESLSALEFVFLEQEFFSHYLDLDEDDIALFNLEADDMDECFLWLDKVLFPKRRPKGIKYSVAFPQVMEEFMRGENRNFFKDLANGHLGLTWNRIKDYPPEEDQRMMEVEDEKPS